MSRIGHTVGLYSTARVYQQRELHAEQSLSRFDLSDRPYSQRHVLCRDQCCGRHDVCYRSDSEWRLLFCWNVYAALHGAERSDLLQRQQPLYR